MASQSYINLTDTFVEGLREYIKKKRIPLDEVVEVFAGNGQLGLALGLREKRNISDLLLFADKWYEDKVNKHWEREPHGVVKETAYETVLRFATEEKSEISLLVIAAPPPANSYYCPSYEAAKALYHRFDSQILYIGEMSGFVFGSPKFFDHMEEVEDDVEESFETLVVKNYNNQDGYFASEQINVRPHLLKFVPCKDKNCDCHDGSKIDLDIQKQYAKNSQV